MKLETVVIYNQDTKMYDCCVVPSGKSVVLELICSCKSIENANWIVDLINNERGF